MKYKGRRQSDNVEDVSKTKKKEMVDWKYFEDDGTPVKPHKSKEMSQETKKQADMSMLSPKVERKLGKQAGIKGMEGAVERDAAKRAGLDAEETEVLMKRFGPKTIKPVELKEVWTPRPLK